MRRPSFVRIKTNRWSVFANFSASNSKYSRPSLQPTKFMEFFRQAILFTLHAQRPNNVSMVTEKRLFLLLLVTHNLRITDWLSQPSCCWRNNVIQTNSLWRCKSISVRKRSCRGGRQFSKSTFIFCMWKTLKCHLCIFWPCHRRHLLQQNSRCSQRRWRLREAYSGTSN